MNEFHSCFKDIKYPGTGSSWREGGTESDKTVGRREIEFYA